VPVLPARIAADGGALLEEVPGIFIKPRYRGCDIALGSEPDDWPTPVPTANILDVRRRRATTRPCHNEVDGRLLPRRVTTLRPIVPHRIDGKRERMSSIADIGQSIHRTCILFTNREHSIQNDGSVYATGINGEKKPMRKLVGLLGILLLGALQASCTGSPPLQPQQTALGDKARSLGARNLVVKRLADGGMSLNGELGGAAFAIALPADWNGEVLLFAHGYTRTGEIAAVSENPAAEDPSTGLLTAAYRQNFAVGHSAYDKGGVGVETGAVNTLRLKRFVDGLGARRVYLSGASMGGSIVMTLIEGHPQEFAGAISACGVVDNWQDELGWQIDMRAVYDYYTRGTDYELPGSHDLHESALSTRPPPLLAWLDTPYHLIQLYRFVTPIRRLFEAAQENPQGSEAGIVHKIAAINHTPPEPASFLFPLLTISFGMNDMKATFNGSAYDNRNKTYGAASLSPEETVALNRGIGRVAGDPAAVAYADLWHRSSGRFTTPLLTIHNRVDSLVPYSQEAGLAAKVDAVGNRAHLAQLTVPEVELDIPGAGMRGLAHCGFTPPQLSTAWNDIRAWVERGEHPADATLP
jgi:pimeloyl-ACP methyl ester carboxylesterase